VARENVTVAVQTLTLSTLTDVNNAARFISAYVLEILALTVLFATFLMAVHLALSVSRKNRR
jgi:hypothetical protein